MFEIFLDSELKMFKVTSRLTSDASHADSEESVVLFFSTAQGLKRKLQRHYLFARGECIQVNTWTR